MKAFEIAKLCRVSHETKEGTFVCYCPAHKEGKERTPSLYITQYDGKVGMHCFAGCTYEEIKAITGHETTAMIELYGKDIEKKRQATAAIAKLNVSKKNKR